MKENLIFGLVVAFPFINVIVAFCIAFLFCRKDNYNG